MPAIIPALLNCADAIGTVTVFDSVTGEPLRKAVVQGATPMTATYYTPDGQPRMIRAYVVGANPRTVAQQARRAIHAEAVAAYKADRAGCAALVADEARRRAITPFMAWCAHYHRTHAAAIIDYWDLLGTPWDAFESVWSTPPAAWDAGASTWDAGTSTWDYTPPDEWDAGASRWDVTPPATWDAGATYWDAVAQSAWDAGASIWIN